jgi:hypothetical protein
MKKLLVILLIASSSFVRAQQSKIVTEDTPFVSDGIEYGYSIKNVSTKEVSNSDFSRYEVTLYATNKSECSRVVLFGQSLTENEFEMKMLAKFDCINATGARLTSKSGEVSAKPMFVTAKVSTKDNQGKTVLENQKVQVGYYIGVGETVQNNVIFIVPLNNKPEVRVRIINKVSVL